MGSSQKTDRKLTNWKTKVTFMVKERQMESQQNIALAYQMEKMQEGIFCVRIHRDKHVQMLLVGMPRHKLLTGNVVGVIKSLSGDAL